MLKLLTGSVHVHTHTHTTLSSLFLRSVLYDPYNPDSSDSEHEMPHSQDQYHISPNQNSGAGPQSKGRWDKPYCKTRSQASNSHDLRPEMQPINSRGPSPDHRLPEQVAHHPDFESVAPPSYGSSGRPVHHRLGSPDRSRHDSSPQRFPASYGAQRTNGDDGISVPEYRREVWPTRVKEHFSKCKYLFGLGSSVSSWIIKQDTGPGSCFFSWSQLLFANRHVECLHIKKNCSGAEPKVHRHKAEKNEKLAYYIFAIDFNALL